MLRQYKVEVLQGVRLFQFQVVDSVKYSDVLITNIPFSCLFSWLVVMSEKWYVMGEIYRSPSISLYKDHHLYEYHQKGKVATGH